MNHRDLLETHPQMREMVARLKAFCDKHKIFIAPTGFRSPSKQEEVFCFVPDPRPDSIHARVLTIHRSKKRTPVPESIEFYHKDFHVGNQDNR